MARAIPQGVLAEIVRAAQARTQVPAAAAGLLVRGEVELAAAGAATSETPFRIASITKWFTASLAALLLDLDEPLQRGAGPRSLLSHTADLRPHIAEPLPEPCRGLWSYSNAGYWLVGEACGTVAGTAFSDALRERLLEPLRLAETGFDEPKGAARGHVQEGRTGQRPAGSLDYPVARWPSGGLWSTVGDLLRFAAHQLGGAGPLAAAELEAVHEPQATALGARYCLGCWRRELAGGRPAVDHEGSLGGYQSLLLLVPEEEAALAVLTNSWRGSGLIRHVVAGLGLVPAHPEDPGRRAGGGPEAGRYALGDSEAVVERRGGRWRVALVEDDPLTRSRTERPAYALDALGDGVHGFAGGLLMTHRADFPRTGVARIGWVALPRVNS